MRRLAMMFPTALLILGATLVGSATAQESVFRYATDPFSAEASTDAPSEEVMDEPADEVSEDTEATPSYDSYSSWPTAGKHTAKKKAIYRAQQRELRIANRLSNGYSASRPEIHGNPFYNQFATSYYAPQPLWGGYNSWNRASTSFRHPSNWYFPRRSISRGYRWIAVPDTYASVFGR